MSEIDDLRRTLEEMNRLRAGRGMRPNGYAYDSMEDFVLQHGEEFTPAVLPEEYEPLEPKLCYQNSMLMAAVHGFEYVEGYAFGSSGIPLPILHAWNVDYEGRLLDFTWAGLGVGVAYLGVRFPFSLARDGPVLDNWQDGWPILRTPWKGGPIAVSA